MEHSYMIVAFIEDKSPGQILEPPKHPHLTIKKKFKLLDLTVEQLIELLLRDESIKGKKELRLGGLKEYDSDDNKVIEVLNPEIWSRLHFRIVDIFGNHIESRDPHFEGKNYYPHVTWKLKGEVTLDPKSLTNKTYDIHKLYLIQRIDPATSKARVEAVIDL